MQIPNFSQDQFLNAPTLNTSMGYIKNSLETSNKTFYTPGLLYSQDLIYTFNNSLTVSLNASPPFAVVDANGILSQALGTTNGTTSSVYTLDFSSFVPSSGSVTVYITATTFSLSLQPYQVIGPPIGHPDYNPSFAPYTAYGETVDSLSITLSTTAPNNQTVFELGRVVLTSGQTAVTSVTTSYQVNCELYISAIDIQPVQNAIQIGQTTSTNQAVIAGVIPSGMSNNLIQFLVNGSNVFIVDVDGNITSAGNLTISGSINSGAITASGLITANGGIATSSIAGNPSFTGGLTVPSGETLTVDGNTVVDTVTASGLITANAGINVSGGTLIIPNATASNEPPALSQLFIGNRKAVFTSSGTWTVPDFVDTIWVSGCAGGGGGGGGGGTVGSSGYIGGGGGSGGGAGQSTIKQAISVTGGRALSVSIGAGGGGGAGGSSSGSSGSDGGSGGNTVLTDSTSSTTLLTLSGGGSSAGGGGQTSTSASLGSGGSGGIAGTGYPAGQYGSDGNYTGNGGSGASGPFGGGGGAGRAGTAGAYPGASASGFGAGGGGGGGSYGVNAFAGGNGGNGSPGFLVIEW